LLITWGKRHWHGQRRGVFNYETHEQHDLITGGGSGIGYELTRQLTALGNTILITGRDQAKNGPCESGLSKSSYLSKRRFRSESDRHSYEQVTKQFPELNILINNAGIMREINVHDKAGSLEDITREIEINLSGPIRMVKQFLPHLKTKSEAAIMNVSSGLAFVSIAHCTGLLRHQGGPAFVHRVSSCATEKTAN